ncbi:Elicitin [Plasmopara halstedii]|uniref:Elicitin n=1 Tax=Plasmopara halstedii TaxID=4781 RepID=A0A0P1A8M1_PLAHL|nr:Elicitin [Plasmopara halstedii]CEG36896.1 Elicitin [Plasmopara halstedii]|eukprot:XP_024573265.1 Elicitin [Plasmopara halstedii]
MFGFHHAYCSDSLWRCFDKHFISERTCKATSFRNLPLSTHFASLHRFLCLSHQHLNSCQMNTFLVTALAALTVATLINGEDCSGFQQSKAYWSMKDLLGDTMNSCSDQSGYNMLKSTSPPTAKDTAAMCKVSICHDFIEQVRSTDPPDCDLYIPLSGAVMNVKSLVDEFKPTCEKLESRMFLASTPKSFNFRGGV